MPTAHSGLTTSISDPRAFLAEIQHVMSEVLEHWCAVVRRDWPDGVGEAIAYSLSAPGKRLRPALVIGVYRELGGTGEAAELAAAVEIVHTYSLVHDDLPCMDDDDLRRGRPTTHRQFDPPKAMDAGYRMVPLAARVLAAGAERLGLEPDRTRLIAQELFQAAGANGMIRGQVLDLEAEGRPVTREELVRIHESKTGALITASGVIGAIAAGAPAPQIDAVRCYGRDIGLAFQIVDDILDATSTSSQLGKTAGKDAEQRKATFASLVGIEAATRESEEHVRLAVDQLGRAGIDSTLLAALARFIAERRR
jgi:geranylgeranyl pyrophosphate synthase